VANDKDFIVKNGLQVGEDVLVDSGAIIKGDLGVEATSGATFLTVDSDGVTLASPGIFTGDGSGLTNVAADITVASVFDLSDVDSNSVTPIQDYVLSFDSATQKFIPSAAVASITIEDSATVIQLINDNIDIGDLRDVDSDASNSPQNNNVLMYSATSSKWIAAASPAALALAEVDSAGGRNNVNPSDGALFYDLDEAGLYVFDGTNWVEAAQDYASFEFIQVGTFSGTVTPTKIFEPLTNLTLKNLRAVTGDANHSGINITINKNGTALGGQTFTIPSGQLRTSGDFSTQHVITSSDDITLGINVPTGSATILAVEVFYA